MPVWAWDYETDYYQIYSVASDGEGGLVLHLPETPGNDAGVHELVQMLNRLHDGRETHS